MDQVIIATCAERTETLNFLEACGLAENSLLLQSLEPAFADAYDWGKVLLNRRAGVLVGVAHHYRSNPSTWTPSCGYRAYIEAIDHDAVSALVEAFPTGMPGRLSALSPIVQSYFQALPGVAARVGDPNFTVTPETFTPVNGELVIELSAADMALFDGCERNRKNLALNFEFNAKSHLFAVIVDGKAVTAAWLGVFARGNHRNVQSISSLETETPYRRRGYGRRLVSHLTELILRDGDVPLFWTEPDNLASQRLAANLGYRRFGTLMWYSWEDAASIMNREKVQ